MEVELYSFELRHRRFRFLIEANPEPRLFVSNLALGSFCIAAVATVVRKVYQILPL